MLLPFTATHCNTLQHTATQACRTEDAITIYYARLALLTLLVDLCCSVLQCVAECCGVLQCHLLFACGPFDIAGKHVF